MCGIAGIVRFDGEPVAAEHLRAMAERLRHRGPDGEGVASFGAAGLAHRRLAIIDVEGGAQPLDNEDGSVAVTFNGEIYNFRELRSRLEGLGHRFRTDCDTEVVVHAYEEWGDRCVEQFRGMFAFGIWDQRKQRLLLARDRVGIKPLYYARLPQMLAFASELQAFDAIGDFEPNIDLQALDLYLHFQYIPAPYSIYREVRKLPPGHTLAVDAAGNTFGAQRYWHLGTGSNPRLSEGRWIERLHEVLDETVRLHLVSDVPFGAFLSGGVDSSTVVAYMSQACDLPVHTFSIAFDAPEFDESPYAREAARRLNTVHHEEIVRPDALGVLPILARHYGEPFADSSAVPTYYVSRLAAEHVKMVLSGDGGDENFAGYTSYQTLLWKHRRPTGFYRRARHFAGGLLRQAGLRPAIPSPDDTWYELAASQYFGTEPRRRLWRPEYRSLLDHTRGWFDGRLREAPTSNLCSRYQHFDLHSYLPHDILAKVDVASMIHGLEVRVPLLDHVLMETVSQLPVELKLRSAGRAADGQPPPTIGKYLFKKNAERFFTRDFLHRAKRGFSIPLADWFRGRNRGELEERLRTSDSPLCEWFEPGVIAQVIDEHMNGRDHSGRLWSLLVLSEWLGQRTRQMAV